MPGFANAAKAMDIFIEELGHAMLGTKEPQAAMAEVKKRVAAAAAGVSAAPSPRPSRGDRRRRRLPG